MLQFFLYYVFSLLYMEILYHISCFGTAAFFPLPGLPLWIAWAGLAGLFLNLVARKGRALLFWLFSGASYLIFAVQLVYIKIFRQPLLVSAAAHNGAAALSDYWRETIYAIFHTSVWLLLLAVPLAAAGLLLSNGRHSRRPALTFDTPDRKSRGVHAAALLGGLALFLLVCAAGYWGNLGFYEEYSGFYDPEGVFSYCGVAASGLRDILGDAFPEKQTVLAAWTQTPPDVPVKTEEKADDSPAPSPVKEAKKAVVEESAEKKEPSYSPHVLPVDFQALESEENPEEIRELAQFMQAAPPTNQNEYTGLFEGYNLIYLTAEGFSPYAVDETLTPTLYRLIHSGFVFENYYVPLWQTSTSDGEYVNLTGLIPNRQFSMRRSASIEMPFCLPAFFASEGVKSYAYHNNTLSYYDRYLSHPNLGYQFKASKLGKLEESVWGGQVFPMENANYWPASDLDMMVATLPEYIGEDRFHVYYMTVSGHMYYTFSGNRMSAKHKEDVADLPYSEEGRAYIACNMELDAALDYLIQQLSLAGKLEKTVICLSADHYPYAMEMQTLEELAKKPLDGTLDLYRNHLILWNSAMETVTVQKPAASVDILPTLLNLFGFDYDSRLYAGRDILSDSDPLVIFSDRSFITDRVSYNKKGQTIWADGREDDAYLKEVRARVDALHTYCAGILNNDFYRYVQEALPEEYRYGDDIDPEWIAPHPPQAPPASETLPPETGIPSSESN